MHGSLVACLPRAKELGAKVDAPLLAVLPERVAQCRRRATVEHHPLPVASHTLSAILLCCHSSYYQRHPSATATAVRKPCLTRSWNGERTHTPLTLAPEWCTYVCSTSSCRSTSYKSIMALRNGWSTGRLSSPASSIGIVEVLRSGLLVPADASATLRQAQHDTPYVRYEPLTTPASDGFEAY